MLAELSLKDSELRYRRLFEATQDGILILDAETGMIEDVNAYLIKMLGYSREEFVKKKLWEVGAFKDIEASKDAFEALQDREYIRYEDLPLKAKDGRLIQVEFVSNVYLVSGEKIIQCNIRDITEHTRIILALKANEKKYFNLLNQSSDGIFIIDLSGNILTVNTAMCRELEFSEEEFLAMKIWDIIPNQYLDQYKERLTKILGGERFEEPGEYEVRGKDGKHHYVAILSTPHYSGRDIVGFQGIARDVTARKQAEQALEESETRNRSLIEHLPTVVYTNAVADTSSTLYVSPQIQNLVGYTPQEWMADPKLWVKTLHPEDRENVLRRAAHTDQSKEPFEMEYRMIARDGRLVWVHDQIILVYDLEGQPQFWQGIMLNITARKQAELARDHLARIVDATEDAVLSKTLEGVITSWNRGAERMYGYSAREAIGRSISFIIPPDNSNELPDILDRIQYGKHIEHYETVRVRKDGKRIHISITVSPLINSLGNIVGASTIARDITERKLVENQLNYHARLLRHISDAVIATDDQLRITAWNRAAAKMYGWTSEDVMGHPISEILSFDLSDEQRVEAREQLKESLASRSETVHHRKDGRTLNVEVNTIALIDEQGKMTGYVSVNRDITERKRAEKALQREKDRAQQYLDIAGVIFLVLGADGKVILINKKGCEILGYVEDEILGQNWFDHFLPQDENDKLRPEFDQIIAGEIELIEYLENPILTKSGQERLIAWHNSVLADEAGRITGVVSSGEDITERKKAEVKIQRQLEHLTALSSIDRVIAGNVDLKLSLSEILMHVTTELGIDAAAILMFNSSSQILEYGAERGFRTRAIRKVPVRLGGSYAGRVVLNRQFIQIQDPGGEPKNLFLETPLADEGFVFYCAVPLITKGQVNGVLEVFQRAAFEPDAEWLDFLYTLAGQAAIAIENATLFESLQRSNSELTQAYDATIEGWSHALDLRDKETEGHSQRVTDTTVRLARAFGLNETELAQVRWGALLHDIGKMGVPDGILHKPGSLTDEEWVAMKQHPTFAYKMLSPIRYLRLALDIPYCHHEKWDGTGYPRGLKGEEIPLSARIFAVVDVWDALCSDRPYRAAWKEEKVRLHILALSGTHFDPRVVDTFMQMPK